MILPGPTTKQVFRRIIFSTQCTFSIQLKLISVRDRAGEPQQNKLHVPPCFAIITYYLYKRLALALSHAFAAACLPLKHWIMTTEALEGCPFQTMHTMGRWVVDWKEHTLSSNVTATASRLLRWVSCWVCAAHDFLSSKLESIHNFLRESRSKLRKINDSIKFYYFPQFHRSRHTRHSN